MCSLGLARYRGFWRSSRGWAEAVQVHSSPYECISDGRSRCAENNGWAHS